jgi:hypothetical protein
VSEDLTTWLRAQLEDDERVARAAAERCGCHGGVPDWDFADDGEDGRIVVRDDPHPNVSRRLSKRWNRSYDDLFAARHIARHDPARVLAEVEAKRRILDWLDKSEDWMFDKSYGGQPDCDAVRALLALPYATRPGYRDEWRP